MWIVPSSFCELPWLLLEDLANKIKNQQHMVAIKNFKNCFAYKDNAAENVSFPQNKNTNQELLFKEQEVEPYETMGFLSQKKKKRDGKHKTEKDIKRCQPQLRLQGLGPYITKPHFSSIK